MYGVNVPYAEGDGVGPEIVTAARRVIDAGVGKAYGGKRAIFWEEAYLGSKALDKFGSRVPEITISKVRERGILFKGPLETPVGRGYRSVNVFIRQKLDLYANIRPVKHIRGAPSPLANPDEVDMVVFRENTDDLYTGIEWPYRSAGAMKLRSFMRRKMGVDLEADAGIGIKQISKAKTARITRAALEYAVKNRRRSVTIMHKGNIMKFTEGAFREWAYETALAEYRGKVVTEDEVRRRHSGKVPKGRILVNDRIADNMFQQIILKPGDYDVILAPNVNGDYVSDAAGALAGSIGTLGSADVGDFSSVFEPVHGTAPKYAGKDVADPIGAIHAGCLMLEHMGWNEARNAVWKAVEVAVGAGEVTRDLAAGRKAKPLGTSGFADAVVEAIR